MSESVGAIHYDVTLETSGLVEGQRKVERAAAKAAEGLETVGGAADRAGQRFTDASGRLRETNGQFVKTGSAAQAAGVSLTKMAAAISAALSAIAVNELVSKIVTAQRQFDVMFASLKTMTGGADQAGLAFDRLRKFAEGTPYTLKQSVDGFVKLKALGLDPSERSMTSFGNTASAMGKDLMQMIEAVADASTGEFERLKEFGIKAKVEGDKVSLTFQGVTTKIANNAKSITEYLVKIGETNFAGAMAERMNTLDGNISNLDDSLQALFLTVSQSGFGDAIAAGVRKATEAITELTTSVKDGELTDYFDKLKPFVTAAEVAVISLSGAIAGRLIAAFVAAAAQAYTTATAIGAATLAARGFTAVLTLMGGPIGIAITGLALLALNWDKVGAEARDAATMSEDAAKRIANALKKTPAAATKALGTQMGEVKGEIAAIDKELARTTFPKADPGQLKELEERRRTLVQIQKDIQTAMNGVGAGGGRGSVNPDFVKPDELKAETKDTKVKTPKFDSSRYLAGLASQVASEWDRVNIIEEEKIREAGEHLKKKEITEKEHQQAVTLIRADAVKDRAALMEREFKDAVADGERRFDAMKAQEEKTAAEQKAIRMTRGATLMTTFQLKADNGGVEDKVALIRAQAEAALAANLEAARLDEEAAQVYADNRVAIEEDMHRRIAEARSAANSASLMSTSDAFGAIAGVLKKADGEQSAIYGAMFAAQKAFAIASAIVNIQAALSSAAMSLPFPGNLAAMGIVAANTASIIGTISGTSYGGARQYGGPTQAGSLYKVNETGQPEMFTGSNGSQYMLSGQGGSVTPADQVGGGGLVYAPVINIDGTADRGAATVQIQKAISASQKDFIEQLKRMKIIPQ